MFNVEVMKDFSYDGIFRLIDLNSNINVIFKQSPYINIALSYVLNQTAANKCAISTFVSFPISVTALATDVYLFVIILSSSLILPNISLRYVSNRSSTELIFLVDSCWN